MAYGLKYELLCTSKKSNLYTVKIKELDYTGADIDRNVPVNPFKLRKDRAAVVKGTSFEFAMREEVDFEFIPFYTSVPKKYLIEVYKATTLLWTGYLNTQQYSAAYKPVPNNIYFSASDGLGFLKNEKFTLTGMQSEMAIICHCIDKIGLGLGYATAISIWEANHDTSLSPLEQTYHDCLNFVDKKCYEVIEKILGRYTAEISQWGGRWQIISSIDKKSTRMLYTSAGVYDTTEAAPAILDLGYPNVSGVDVWPIGVLTHSIQPGGNKIKLTHDYGLRDSVLKNFDFENFDFDSNLFDDWSYENIGSVFQYNDATKKYTYIPGYQYSDDYMWQSKSIVNAVGHTFVLSLLYGAIQATVVNDSYVTENMTVRVMIYLTNGSSTKYLTTTGWSDTATVHSLTASGFITPIFSEFKILTDEIPFNGDLYVRLYRLKYTAGSKPNYRAALFGDIIATFLDENSESYVDKYEKTATFDNSSELVDLADIDFIAADAPDVSNNDKLYDKITRLSDDTPTSEWNLADNDSVYTLIELYLKLLASQNRMPRQTLNGTIKSTSAAFNSIIKHAYNSNREFEIADCSWDLYEEKFNATLLEVLAFSDEDISLDDGTTIPSAADLTVASVTPDGYSKQTSASFNTTVHIDNSGEMPGRQYIDWKIVNASDNIQSSGTHISGVVPAADDEDHVIAMSAPATAGTYYVKCKISTDSTWVTSSAITVDTPLSVSLNEIFNIFDGYTSDPMNPSFEATATGLSGNKTIYWRIRHSNGSVLSTGSQSFAFTAGTSTKQFTGINYPAIDEFNWDFQIGLTSSSFTVTSNDFNTSTPI